MHRDVKLENVLVASQKRAYAGGPLLYTVACQIYQGKTEENLGKRCLVTAIFLAIPGVFGVFLMKILGAS